jgi:hypothetical protein
MPLTNFQLKLIINVFRFKLCFSLIALINFAKNAKKFDVIAVSNIIIHLRINACFVYLYIMIACPLAQFTFFQKTSLSTLNNKQMTNFDSSSTESFKPF